MDLNGSPVKSAKACSRSQASLDKDLRIARSCLGWKKDDHERFLM